MSLTHDLWRSPASTPIHSIGNIYAPNQSTFELNSNINDFLLILVFYCLLIISSDIPACISRFRMRQVNIVGTSPPSQPSRKIQTLQAPPDMAPANVTLRTASETSLWLRWVVC